MNTELHTEWTVADICSGFTYNELEEKGLFGETTYRGRWGKTYDKDGDDFIEK